MGNKHKLLFFGVSTRKQSGDKNAIGRTSIEDRWKKLPNNFDASTREYYRKKYPCTVDLLFDWFWISLFCK